MVKKKASGVTAAKVAPDLSPQPTMLASSVLMIQYLLAPFYCYPHKLLFNYLLGAPYARAYEHFRRDHSTPTNLCLHLLCLVLQVTGNFAFTMLLDVQFIGPGLAYLGNTTFGIPHALSPFPYVYDVPVCLTSVSALSWMLYLLSTPTHMRVHGASLISIVLGCFLGGLALLNWVKFTWLLGLSQCLVLSYHRFYPWTHQIPFVVLVLARFGLQAIISHWFLGSLQQFAVPIVIVVLLIQVWLSHRPFRRRPNCFFLAIWGWVPALLTLQPCLLFLSIGMLASSLQGCAHKYTKELPTLPQLDANMADELAHTTFFPCLLWQSVCQSLHLI